ncbi:MAG: choline-sulfatase [Rhodobiaceae bacterium]
MASPTRPNIVLIMADQLAPHFTGAYGHGVVKTPNLDALAARGARFDAAYCNSPLCAPSRAAFMTGQLISRLGTYDNASDFAASVPTFAHYLRQAGYRTCLAGRMHFVGPDQLHGFEERVTTDVYPADFAWVPDWQHADQRIDRWYHNMDSVFEAGSAVTAFQIEYDEEVGFAARRRLMQYACDRDAPFALVASFMNPHDPYVALPEFWNLYDDDAIDLPETGMNAVDRDPFSARVFDGIGAGAATTGAADIRRARRGYYANVSYFDSKIGEIVGAVEEIGQLDNTIFIVTSDHGDMLGERGLWYKMSFFEHSARVPLVIAGPGIAEGRIASPCSLVDLLPTMLDFAGAADMPMGRPVDGRSLAPMARGGDEDDGCAIGEYCAEMTASPVFMIRRGAWKYVHCDDDPPQLYHLDDDPLERINLAADPGCAQIAADFAAEVVSRWDSATLRDDVIASQAARRVVHRAMQTGRRTDWDYTPPRDAAEEYVRNHIDWTVAAARTRFPPLAD